MVVLGLALAFLGVYFFPEWLGPRTAVVEVREEAPQRDEAPPPAGGERLSYASAVERAMPAVVNIFTTKEVVRDSHPLVNDPLFKPFFRDPNFAPRLQKQTSLGSGVIVSPQGYILTNNHVIAGADEIEVMLANGKRYQAQAIGADPETDIAVLKVAATDLPSLVIKPLRNLRVGDIVLAIGNPFGVGQTVTQGIISATGRNQLGLNTFEDFIQTDAAINPGSSGGALVDTNGQLVGINTAIFTRSGGSNGIGFAIPATLARDVMKQIIEHGQVIRGWLGVEGTNVPADLVRQYGLTSPRGVMITNVFPDGPADKAGIRPNDILLEIDGQPIDGVRNALNTIARRKPGSKLTIRGLRDGEPFSVEAEVSIRPIQPDAS